MAKKKASSTAKTVRKSKPWTSRKATDARERERSAQRELKERELWAKDHYLRAVPKGVVCLLTDRQHKVLKDWVVKYGAPLAEETVDLYLLLKFFAERLVKFGSLEKSLEDMEESESSDGSECGTVAHWTLANLKEKNRNMRADTRGKMLRNSEKEGRLVDVHKERQALAVYAAELFDLFQDVMEVHPDMAKRVEAAHARFTAFLESMDDRRGNVDQEATASVEAATANDPPHDDGSAALVRDGDKAEEAPRSDPVRRRRNRSGKRTIQSKRTQRRNT